MRCIRKYLDEKSSQTLIYALVIGPIDYCNSILYGLPARELTKLQRLQNSAARIIFNIPKMCYMTPVLRELHWLKVQFRIQFKFIMINGHGPIYLKQLVELQQNGPYNIRSSNKGLMLQAPNAITMKTWVIVLICVQRPNFGKVFPITCVTRYILVNSKFH